MAATKRKTEQTKTESKEIKNTAIAKRKPRPEESQAARKIEPVVTITFPSWATPIVGLAMLIVGLLGGYFLRPLTLAQSPNAASVSVVTPPIAIPTTDNSAAQKSMMDSVVAKTRHFKGNANATVTIIEFGDFQCPFCGRYATGAGLQVEAQYIKTGKARFGFYNFAFLGAESTWAAEAAECASDQNKYWEYHDKLYNNQSGENQGAFSKDNLKKFANELGLDTKAFNDCLDSGKYTSLVQGDTNTSGSLGVQSTPTFLINGKSVIGAQPFEVFQQAIEPLLK